MSDPTASRAPLSPQNFARLVLILVGVIWLCVGLSAMVNPVDLADWVDFDLETNTALAEFRAMYGGLSIALALLHGGAAIRGAWLRPALMMSSVITAGLLVGRLSSLVLDGMFGAFVLGLALGEVVLLGLSAAALWRLWRAPDAPVPTPQVAAAAAPAAPAPTPETVQTQD